MRNILVYDGSFDGFLTVIFDVYDEKLTDVTIQPKHRSTQNFFDTSSEVVTDEKKAHRVWEGISKACSKKGKTNIYRAFLSELDGIEDTLFHFIKRSLAERVDVAKDYGDAEILKISKVVKMVGREKHRMDAFVRFRQTKDGLYFATVSPDFNVLPLLIKHFKTRYADQQWIIYDLKRDYGIYYNLQEVTTMVLENSDAFRSNSKNGSFFTEEERTFESLWKNYFKSTNIVSRKNTKLHLQHVPKRYWKYLSEKSPV